MSNLLESIARRRRASAARRLGPGPGTAYPAFDYRSAGIAGYGEADPPVIEGHAIDLRRAGASADAAAAGPESRTAVADPPAPAQWVQPEAPPEPEPVAEPEPEPVVEALVEPEPVAEPEPIAESGPEPEALVEPAPEPGAPVEAGPEPEPLPDPEPYEPRRRSFGRKPEPEPPASVSGAPRYEGWLPGPNLLSLNPTVPRAVPPQPQPSPTATPPAQQHPSETRRSEPRATEPAETDIRRREPRQSEPRQSEPRQPRRRAQTQTRPEPTPVLPSMPITSTELIPQQPQQTTEIEQLEEPLRVLDQVPVAQPLPERQTPLPETMSRPQMRRRIRYLRQLREIQLRDLGGFALELHRFGRERPEIVRAKLESAAQTDRELRQLEMLLYGKVTLREIREPGIGGVCGTCGAVHGSEDRYCSSCGEPLIWDNNPER